MAEGDGAAGAAGASSGGADEEGTVTWRELLAETERLVGDRRHARWICERATSTSPREFLGLLDAPATERAVEHLDAMTVRARRGEPIQYVLGSWAFRRIELRVDARVLIPRPETEEIAGIAIDLAAAVPGDRVVIDLGTGSGAIGLSLADELPLAGTTVWMTDVSPDALDVAGANLAGIGRAARNVRLCGGSWYAALPDDVMADVIVSNPPYVADGDPVLDAEVAEWEPAGALFGGADGLDALREIVGGAPERLRPGGWLVVEHGHDQGPAVRELMAAAGLTDTTSHRDAAGHDRGSSGRRAG